MFTRKETLTKKFTILFYLNLLSIKLLIHFHLSNFNIVKTKEIRKDSGINFVKILGTFKRE